MTSDKLQALRNIAESCGKMAGMSVLAIHCDDVLQLLDEIERLNKEIIQAIDKLFIKPDGDECPNSDFPNKLCTVDFLESDVSTDISVCRKCWRKYLEWEGMK